jgi:hypothetical protein
LSVCSCKFAGENKLVQVGRGVASVTDIFWEKVSKGSKCWYWIGKRDRCNYGVFRYQGKKVGAHRFAYFDHYGVWPLVVCHHCDNPPCVRPDHLFAGTHSDNMKDMWNKERSRPLGRPARRLENGGFCGNGHPVTNTSYYVYGGKKRCKSCQSEWSQRYYRRKISKKLSLL